MSEYRVLMADGNALFRRSVREMFKTDKDVIRFVEASNGQEALEKLREEHFDVLISELVMPMLDGLDLFGGARGRALREARRDNDRFLYAKRRSFAACVLEGRELRDA